MKARTAHRISFVAGVLILALVGIGRMQPPVPVCGSLPANYEPIIAFEMARSIGDLHAIFGDAPGECRTAMTAQMDRINVIDSAIYIPIYGSFLIFLLLGLRTLGSSLASRGAIIVAMACAADYFENMSLFGLSADPDSTTSSLIVLAIATEVKWVGLGIAGAIAGYLLSQRGGAWKLAIAPCSLGLIASLISIVAPSMAGPYLSLSFLFAWLLFLIVDARESFRK